MGFFSALLGKTDNTELKQIIENGAFLVDVRSPAEYAGGTVNGAVNIPLDRVSNEINKFKGKENIVVFCQSGNRSGMAKNILEQNGIENVINGGGWRSVANVMNA